MRVKNMRVKKIRNNKGFTLVEIIVSVAIIGILAIAFFGLFGFSINTIITSGHNSVSDFNAQSILEDRIGDPTTTSSQLEVVPGTINLYKSGALAGTVSGKVLRVSYPYNKTTTKTAVTFIPD